MSQGNKKQNRHTAPSISDPNPFSLLDSVPQSSSEPPTRQTSPEPGTRPSTPHQPSDNFIWISTEFSTTQSRVLTYQEWPHTNISPQKRAKFGFYHLPVEAERDNVRCFACGVHAYRWRSESHSHADMLLSLHEEDCIWAELLRETQSFTDSPPSCTESSRKRSSTPTDALTSTPTNVELNQAPITESKLQEPLQTQHSSPAAFTPRPTYASVLKTSPKSQPRAEPKSYTPISRSPSPLSLETPTAKAHYNSPSITPTPTLTIEDLRNRFHNKPSPFKLTDFNQRHAYTAQN